MELPELISPDPFETFARWFEAAAASGAPLPESCTLSTVGLDGSPEARVVLLKDHGPEGFSFFTNYQSAKGAELEAHPRAALSFHWAALAWQVRARGEVSRLPAEASDAYFATRPRGSQLSAWASAQSREVPDRAALEEAMAAVEARFEGGPVPRPPHWGGYLLAPEAIEFWIGRADRLHDRVRFERGPEGWIPRRLSP